MNDGDKIRFHDRHDRHGRQGNGIPDATMPSISCTAQAEYVGM